MRSPLNVALLTAIAVGGAHAQEGLHNYNVFFGDVSATWVDWPGEPAPLLMLVNRGGKFLRVFDEQNTRTVGVTFDVVEWAVLGDLCQPTPVYLTTNIWGTYYDNGGPFDVLSDYAGGLGRRIPAKPFVFKHVGTPQSGSDGGNILSIEFCPNPAPAQRCAVKTTDCSITLAAILCRVTLDRTSWWGYGG